MADAERVPPGRRVLAVCLGCGNPRAVAARHAGAAVTCQKCGRDVPVADGPDPSAPAPSAPRPGRAGRSPSGLAAAVSAGRRAASAGLLAALR